MYTLKILGLILLGSVIATIFMCLNEIIQLKKKPKEVFINIKKYFLKCFLGIVIMVIFSFIYRYLGVEFE
jgi:hypothetical protein